MLYLRLAIRALSPCQGSEPLRKYTNTYLACSTTEMSVATTEPWCDFRSTWELFPLANLLDTLCDPRGKTVLRVQYRKHRGVGATAARTAQKKARKPRWVHHSFTIRVWSGVGNLTMV